MRVNIDYSEGEVHVTASSPKVIPGVGLNTSGGIRIR